MSAQTEELFDAQGCRLYLTLEERAAVLEASKAAPRPVCTLYYTLHTTECGINEAMQLTPRRIDLAAQLVTFETLRGSCLTTVGMSGRIASPKMLPIWVIVASP